MLTESKMKAARFYGVGKPLIVEEVPIPEIGDEDVLLQVKAAGICGSDIHIVEGSTPSGFSPITLGHEFAGIIVKTGSRVQQWTKGDRVCVDSIVFCGHCKNCLVGRESICAERKLLGIHLDGGLAEFVRVPASNLIDLPDNVPFEHGAILTDAAATPFHALTKKGRFRLGQTLAVIGVGGLGFHAVQLGSLAGAAKVIAVDICEERLDLARTVGADHVVNASLDNVVEKIRSITGGMGADLVVECIGMPLTVCQAVESTRIGGRTALIGLGPEPLQILPPNLFVRSEVELIGSYAFDRTDIQSVVELAACGKFNVFPSVSKTFSLFEVNEALRHLKNKVDNPIRIVVTP